MLAPLLRLISSSGDDLVLSLGELAERFSSLVRDRQLHLEARDLPLRLRQAAMSKWVEEELEPGLRVSYGLKEVLASTKSKWQTVDLVDLQPFGRVLMIDGLVQSCQSDEFVYHAASNIAASSPESVMFAARLFGAVKPGTSRTSTAPSGSRWLNLNDRSRPTGLSSRWCEYATDEYRKRPMPCVEKSLVGSTGPAVQFELMSTPES